MPPEMCAKSQVVTAGGCRGPRGPVTCSDFTLGGGPGGGGVARQEEHVCGRVGHR